MLKEGDKAPDFELEDQKGKFVSLKNFRGKKVILYFYPEDDTSGCTKQACDFRDSLSQFKKYNAEVLGISADNNDSHRKFSQKFDLNFQILSDTEKKTLSTYGVWKEKNMFGNKYMGIVRTTFVIDENGKIIKIFPRVRVENHIQKVLDLVKT